MGGRGMSALAKDSSLCARCQGITLEGLKRESTYGADMPLFADGDQLKRSSKECALCSLMAEALLRNHAALADDKGPAQASVLPLLDRIAITPKADPLGIAFPERPSPGAYLTGFVVTATNRDTNDMLRGKIRFYLDGPKTPNESTKASLAGRIADQHGISDRGLVYDVPGRPRLSSSSCDAAFSLVGRWLRSCKDQHPACRETLSGHALDESHIPQLPRRVLFVRDGVVKLMGPSASSGRYAALSHCWGPRHRQPLRTTTTNLTAHERSIDWETLPRTFQDAITVTRRLGLDYIWIDSLCIVQDDRDDWLKESKNMGAIYESAEVTIAACHAGDSSQGFLADRRQVPDGVGIPHFFPDSRSPDSPMVFADIRRDTVKDTFPEEGILNSRAWATQEWLLSRRMVFYTTGAIIWSCKTVTQRETGDKCYNIARDPQWKTVIERYSERKLSVLTDKLIALDGLRSEMERKTGYEYVYGLWKESLPDQLLWQVTERSVDILVDPLSLPTWTWAHVASPIRFLPLHGAKNLCDSISMASNSNRMVVRARMKAFPAFSPTVGNKATTELSQAIFKDIKASYSGTTATLAEYIVSEDYGCIGWVVCDSSSRQGKAIHCIALMGSLGRRDEDSERRTGLVVSKKLRHYWILVVQEEDDGSYTRLGVGKTYGREWWRDTPSQDIPIA